MRKYYDTLFEAVFRSISAISLDASFVHERAAVIVTTFGCVFVFTAGSYALRALAGISDIGTTAIVILCCGIGVFNQYYYFENTRWQKIISRKPTGLLVRALVLVITIAATILSSALYVSA